MRKKVLTIIPILLLLVVIGVLASITVLILTKKDKGLTMINASKIEAVDSGEFLQDDIKVSYSLIYKDKKNNFIIKPNGKIVITNHKSISLSIKSGDLVLVKNTNGENIYLPEPQKSGSYYSFSLTKEENYYIIIENLSTNEINIGFIKLYK